MTDYKGKRFCVLGDSISTFSGYTPEEAVFYNSYMPVSYKNLTLTTILLV